MTPARPWRRGDAVFDMTACPAGRTPAVRVEECSYASHEEDRPRGCLTVISAPVPPTPDGFRSDRVQVLNWRVDENFSDPDPHLHTGSDEVYVVLEGSIDVEVDCERIEVGQGEAFAVEAGATHCWIGTRAALTASRTGERRPRPET